MRIINVDVEDRDDAAVADAHDILCNSWRGPGVRLDKLRRVADALRGFA